jgi:hypothetical protein
LHSDSFERIDLTNIWRILENASVIDVALMTRIIFFANFPEGLPATVVNAAAYWMKQRLQ